VCGSRAVFNIGAVLGRKEAGHVGLGGPLDERNLGQEGAAADARDYYVDIWRVAALVHDDAPREYEERVGVEHHHMLF